MISSSTSTLQQKEADEENVALAAKGKKKKGGSSSGAKYEKDMSKVKCFAFQGYGHYAGQCPHKKKNKKKEVSVGAASAAVEEFSRKLRGVLASVSSFR